MPPEADLETQMLQNLLATGHPMAVPKGLMLAAAALHGGDGMACSSLLGLLSDHPMPAEQAQAFGELASDLGAWHLAQDRTLQALDWFERAQKAAPMQGRIHANAAAALMRLGRFDQAEEALAKAQSCQATQPFALGLLGNLKHAQGDLSMARQALEEALALQPNERSIRIDLAEVLKDMGLFEPALALLDGASGVDELCARGNILKSMGDAKAAASAYDGALVMKPSPAIRAKRAFLLPVIADSLEHIAQCRANLQRQLEEMIQDAVRIADPEREVGTTPFHLAYHGLNDRPLMELAARFWRQACPSLNFQAAHVQCWRPGKRLKIGFVSRHLHAHTMAKLNRGIIADLARSRFEVFVFQIGKQDDTAREIAATADHCVKLAGPLDSIRQTLADAKLDIIYYPDIGMEPTTYFLAFAKLAPVQIVACGHPDTTGLSTLDAFISGDPLDDIDAQAHYTEPLIRLPGFPFYMRKPAIDSLMPDRDKLGLPENKRLYVCPQSLFKFHPDFDAMLADILTRDPRGQLVLIEQLHPMITAQLKERLKKTIPDLDARLIVLGRLSPQDFMTLLVSADAVLDPWRFGGGSSSLEAFAQGVPVVTRPGEFLRERVTMAAYRKMGIEDLIADSADSYADIAVRLAKDFSWSASLAARLQQAAPALYLDRTELKRMEEAMIALVERKLNF
ncbi:putative TPR repeat-containing protein [Rhodospirillaceae bacterium LM-1]|nr:putative TPR repeat-containing protein [Rhodospirillaceae bacterium LM-1]